MLTSITSLLVVSQVPMASSMGSSSNIVQHAYDVPGSYSGDYNYTFPLPVQAGDLLVVAAAFSSGATVRVSDSLHSIWPRGLACYAGDCFSDIGLGIFYANTTGGAETIVLNSSQVMAFEAFEISNANQSLQGGGGGGANIVRPVAPYRVYMSYGFGGGEPRGEFAFAFGAMSGVNGTGSCVAGQQQSTGNWTIESYCGKTLAGDRQVFAEYGTTPAAIGVNVSLTTNESEEYPGHLLTRVFVVDPAPGSTPTSVPTPPNMMVSCSNSTSMVGSRLRCTAKMLSTPHGGYLQWSSPSGSFSVSGCTMNSASCVTDLTLIREGSALVSASYTGDTYNSPTYSSFGIFVYPSSTIRSPILGFDSTMVVAVLASCIVAGASTYLALRGKKKLK